MLESLPVTLSGPILEPCAGERDIAEILRQSGLQVEDTDIIDGPGLDATTDDYWADRAPDWTITNPPFNAATKILQQAYANSRRGVLIFLRITYLEPCPDRAEWLDTHADQLRWCQVVNPRPIFRADTNKTDSATCVWLLWDKHWSWLSQGIEPPFRFSNGARCLLDKRRTAFPRSTPKLKAANSRIAPPEADSVETLTNRLKNVCVSKANRLIAEGVAGGSIVSCARSSGNTRQSVHVTGGKRKYVPVRSVAALQADVDRGRQLDKLQRAIVLIEQIETLIN
jgi:hypothetical protein